MTLNKYMHSEILVAVIKLIPLHFTKVMFNELHCSEFEGNQ